MRGPRTAPWIAIGAARVDAGRPAAEQIPAGWRHADAAAWRSTDDPYFLIKLEGPVGSDARRRLARAGLEVVAPYPFATFLVRAPRGATADSLAAGDGVLRVERFHPYFKIGRDLAEAWQAGSAAALAGPAEGWGLRLSVGLHEPALRDEVARRLQQIPGVAELLSGRRVIRIRVDPGRFAELLPRIAAEPEVAWVEPWLPAVTANDENVQTAQRGVCNAAGPEQPNTPLFNRGLTGWNARIVVADTCVDANEGWFYDDLLARLPAHETAAPWNAAAPDWAQRKLVEYYDMYSADTTIGCGGASGCGASCPDHGTHVAGSATGNCSLDPEGIASATVAANSDGDSDGAAPGAKLIVQDLGGSALSYINTDGGDLGELIDLAYANTCDGADCGIDIHNNSWFASTDAYTDNARAGDHSLWTLKNLIALGAAGNAGSNFDTIRAPATGKNMVGVGSAAECSVTTLATNSSRGDTSDGRLKPDIVVGGENVTSAANDGNSTINVNGGCQFFDLDGTSMASGTAAGLAALVLQYFNDGFYPGGEAQPADALDPSGMLLKAMLIHAGRRMTGGTAEQNGVSWPNMDQGYGYVVLDDALHFTGELRTLWVHDEPSGVDVSGPASMSFRRFVTSSDEPLKVTLVWYDREHPGSCGAGAPCLLNDLDLSVTNETSGTTYSVTLEPVAPSHVVPRTLVPSGAGAGQTTVDNGPDDLNSVEQVILHTPAAGANYTFTVSAASTPDGPIPFALVATGALAEPCELPDGVANNTTADSSPCVFNGIEIGWAQDLGNWNDGGSGTRLYRVLRNGQPLLSGACAGDLPYGTTSCIDTTVPPETSATYEVAYVNGCGAAVTTAGAAASDETGHTVEVTPDAPSAQCPGTIFAFGAAADPPAGNYTYRWLEDGEVLPGETGTTLQVAKGAVETHNYNCEVTDVVTGCVAVDPGAPTARWTTDLSDVVVDGSFDPLTTLTESCGDGDAFVEPGELWEATVRLLNTSSCGTAHNVRADLVLGGGSAVTAQVCRATGYFGNVGPSATATATYTFDVDAGAVCAEDVTFDVTNVWWNGGGVNSLPAAFDVGVGFGTPDTFEGAVQSIDPLETGGIGTSFLTPAFSLPTADTAELDYQLSCGPGPLQAFYSSGFADLSGWTITGNVSIDSTVPNSCPQGDINTALFAGSATLTRSVGTSGLTDIRIEADFRGEAGYSQPGECFQWWYSLDGGSNWVLYKEFCGASIPPASWSCDESFSFPAGAENNSGFRIRFATTGGVSVRLDDVRVRGRAAPCDVENHVRVQLVGPGNDLFLIKDTGDPDPSKPVDVTAIYNHVDGGPGQWRIRVQETSTGTATLSGATLGVLQEGTGECDLELGCACPAGDPGEVSDDPPHLLLAARNGTGVDLRFEDLGAASYNVYVSTLKTTSPFDVGGSNGKLDCNVPTGGAPGGMRLVSGYDPVTGIAAASDVFFILVTADNGAPTEGIPGFASSGAARSTSATCAH